MPDKTIETGLNDDFTSFTVLNDDGNLDDIQDDGDLDGDQNGNQDDGNQDDNQDGNQPFFDIDNVLQGVPEDKKEEVTGIFDKMQKAFDTKTKERGDAVSQQNSLISSLVDRLKGTPLQNQNADVTKPGKPSVEESGLQFKFEDKDYYEPVFKEIVGLISKMNNSISSMKQGYADDQSTSFSNGIKKFFSDEKNNVTENVIRKMDEIAAEYGKDSKGNFIMFKNLPRLLKMAKSDLGVEDKVTKIPQKNNSRVGVKRQIESRSRRKSNIPNKVASTMQQAWELAEDQLSQNE